MGEEKLIAAARFETMPGTPRPMHLGAYVQDEGVQFSLVTRHATGVSVLLFDSPTDAEPTHELVLDPQKFRQGDLWSIFVRGLCAGQLYLFRVDGPWQPDAGLWFNPHRPILDPYAKAVTGSFDWAKADARPYDPDTGPDGTGTFAMATESHLAGMPRCIVIDDHFEWGDDRPLRRPMRDTVIYEMHARGFTKHPSSGVEFPGTYRGIVEKIPYLLDLGITAIELMPVQQFDTHIPRRDPLTGAPLANFWGYDPIAFFAPHAQYSAEFTANPAAAIGAHVREFKEMVAALHAEGIEVILDVVFNHTAEGAYGPTMNFRGLDNPIYYMIDPREPGKFLNYTGCGNTVNCNHPIVHDMIIDCLHYWVLHMHVDGFRFDLASVLGRDESGAMLTNPPLLRAIAEDPILRDTKIIAEAWDAGGAYQVGEFPGRWSEWNGKFRDDVRRFWRGDAGTLGPLATRLAGSSDLYERSGRQPLHSINFITSHDGFTLQDLVSFREKHNLRNGEDNRDGDNNNHSANYGAEGPTDDDAIRTLRLKQAKNLMATLMLSQGVPMVLGGDEFLRTQQGNNNAYCQDNEMSWFDWGLVEQHAEFHRFVRELIRFRRRHPAFTRAKFFSGEDTDGNKRPDISWFDYAGREPQWNDPNARTLGCLMDGSHLEIGSENDDNDVLLLINGGAEPITFTIPDPPGERKVWRVFIDTGSPFARGINPRATGIMVFAHGSYRLADRSLACLLSIHRGPR